MGERADEKKHYEPQSPVVIAVNSSRNCIVRSCVLWVILVSRPILHVV